MWFVGSNINCDHCDICNYYNGSLFSIVGQPGINIKYISIYYLYELHRIKFQIKIIIKRNKLCGHSDTVG